MTDGANTRELALDILLAVMRDGEFFHIALKNVLDKYRYLPRRDRAFIARLSSGTLERAIELDYIVDCFSKVKTNKMKPVIRAILQCGVYQLKYMDAVPASAACNEAVKLAGKRGFSGLKGFVNGVLRNIAKHLDDVVYPDPKEDLPRFLSVRYSVPQWLAGRFLAQYGQERCVHIFEAYLREKPVSVRADAGRISVDELIDSLKKQGISAVRNPRLPYALYLSGYETLEEIPEFGSGLLNAQDISSMMVAETAQPQAGDFVLDVCAAPGGKSIHIAQMLAGTGMVEARDVSAYKTALIEENAKRCRTDNLRVKVWDAREYDREMEAAADIVIADLPCSGLGVIRTKPDIKYNASEEKIRELAALQKEILSVVRRYVKPGGTLVYSTCTMTPEENEEQAEWFSRTFPEFQLQEQTQLLPDEGCDGFYIAKFSRVPEKTDIKSMPLPELEAWAEGIGEKKFRAKQIYHWMHVRQVETAEQMTNLPVSLREKIRTGCAFPVLRRVVVQESALDGTRKYLFELPDGNQVESVFMRYKHGNSVCISSQVGCRMGCRFCASAIGGLVRNLTPAEMLEQIYRISADTGERVSNVVVMGTGEPLDNYDHLLVFLRMLTDENGLHISQRNVTVSTCGIVPRMRQLAEEKLQITLALSLHAADQKTREQMMPVAKSYGIDEVIEACRYYFEKTGRRVTFEYSLVSGVNDGGRDAARLAKLVGGLTCHVNLIPVNPVRERDFVQPGVQSVQNFKKLLENERINVTIRRELGRDIDGACGQLRKHFAERQDL